MVGLKGDAPKVRLLKVGFKVVYLFIIGFRVGLSNLKHTANFDTMLITRKIKSLSCKWKIE